MPENRFLSTCVLLLLSLSLAASAHAQKTILVRGELRGDGREAAPLNEFQIEIVPSDRLSSEQLAGQRAQVQADGTFLVRDVVPGPSRLRVINARGESLVDDFVTVQQGVLIQARLPERNGAHAPAGTVSAQELAHPTPVKALKEYYSAKKAAAEGDFHKSIVHFERAVHIHPQFFQAWNDLGAAFVKEKRFSEAVEAFRKASALEPDSAVIGQNLRVAEYWAGHPSSKPF